MSKVIQLERMNLETNSHLWQLIEVNDVSVLQVRGNNLINHLGGKVALIGEPRHNYTMCAEMHFLGHHFPPGIRAGWFGFVMRAQDTDNYELVWFMPQAESDATIAYLAVAHGVVPWWTEAYQAQKKGILAIPGDGWFSARVEVKGDEFDLIVEDQPVFTKKLTYYLTKGRPGFYVGTATDAAFRRVRFQDFS